MMTANEAKKLVDTSKIKLSSELAAKDFLTVFERYLKKIAAEGRTELIVSHSFTKGSHYGNEIENELEDYYYNPENVRPGANWEMVQKIVKQELRNAGFEIKDYYNGASHLKISWA